MRKAVFILLLIIYNTATYAQQIVDFNGTKIVEGKIIFKLKPHNQLKSSNSQAITISKNEVFNYLQAIGASKPQPISPQIKMPQNCENCVDISQIHTCFYFGKIPFGEVLSTLNQMPNVEYAEPATVGELLFSPNDPEFVNGRMFHINTCGIKEAWDITQGDESVVIGFTDAGFDITHTDLVNQIHYNQNDPLDGIDNDGDGYVDNFRGWNVALNNNNPQSLVQNHGTISSGIASAEVNNAFGTAGVGYKCKFLPVKVTAGTNDDLVTSGYEGILYAANQGCKIINCSWGNPSYSKFGEDVVNYATFNCDALVVASAGNSGTMELYYPASYEHAMSVGGTVIGDFAWESANGGTHYNQFVDICAPASGFYSLDKNNQTFNIIWGGTSFSAPIVSGSAALVRSKFPELTALQTAELLRVTADDIYEIGNDPKYTDMLGSGRVNAYKALTTNNLPSIRISKSEIKNHADHNGIFAGDKIDITITFKNYLQKGENITINVASESSAFLAVDNSVEIAEFEANSEQSHTFTFEIASNIQTNTSTFFKFTFRGANNYQGYQYFPITFNQDFYDFTAGNFDATAFCNGEIAVAKNRAECNGFTFKGSENCVNHAGIMLTRGTDKVYSSNAWYHSLFQTNKRFDRIANDSTSLLLHSNYEAEQFVIDQYIYNKANIDALFYEYRITNNHSSTLTDLRFATIFDWALPKANNNKAWFVDSLNLTIVSSIVPNAPVWGFMGIDTRDLHPYLFDVKNDKTVILQNKLSNSEIFEAFATDKKSVGTNSILGADVAALSHTIIGDIEPESQQVVRYAILAADSETELLNLAKQICDQYDPTRCERFRPDIPNVIDDLQSENPQLVKQNDCYGVQYPKSNQAVQISVTDSNGSTILRASILPENQTGFSPLKITKQGFYVTTILCNGKNTSFKFVIE